MQLRQMEASDFLLQQKCRCEGPDSTGCAWGYEAWSSTMHQKMQECQEQLAQNRKEEEGLFGAENWWPSISEFLFKLFWEHK